MPPNAPAPGSFRDGSVVALDGRQLIVRRVEEVEAAAAGKGEDRLDDPPARRLDRRQRGFEILDVDDGERRPGRLGSIGLEPYVGIAAQGRGIGRPEIGQVPAEGALVKGLGWRDL